MRSVGLPSTFPVGVRQMAKPAINLTHQSRWAQAIVGQPGAHPVIAMALAAAGLWAVLGSAPTTAAGSASVVTDSSEYRAGAVVTITGADFAAYETVTLQVTHADGTAEADMGHEPVTTMADGAGGFSATWAIAAADVAGNDFVVTASGAVSGTVQSAFRWVARIETDKSDYQPGETATITGSDFAPGEPVTLQIVHLTGADIAGGGHEPFTVTADGGGQVLTAWLVNPDDSPGSTFLLTATGVNSGRTASAVFTDAVGTPPDTTADVVYGQGGSFITNTEIKGGISANSFLSPARVALDRKSVV